MSTQGLRVSDTPSWGEHVEPEHACHDHFLKHQGREVHERNQMIHTLHVFLNDMDESFNLRHMFVVCAHIQPRSCSGQGSLQCLEFAVNMNHLDKEATRTIEMHHCLEGFSDCILLLIQ